MKMGIDHHQDTRICPLCGESNQCALTADPSATECWCDSEEFPRELLAQIPGNAIQRGCICQKCLEQYLASADSLKYEG